MQLIALDDFIKLIEEICNVYPEQGRGLTNRIGNNTASNSNSGNGSMVNVNIGNVENTTIANGWEVFLRFLWDKISSASTDSMIYIHLFLPFLSMLTAMARDSEVAVYVCNLLAANYSIANEELRDDHLATWSNIFGALRDYYEGFRTNMVPAMEAIRTCPQASSWICNIIQNELASIFCD